MTKLRAKLLVNAEAFGFGPSAAIAGLLPGLRKRFDHIAYVGSGHSLDLQRRLPYDAIYDVSGPDGDERFRRIVVEYDLFFTALDTERASAAIKTGTPSIVYDPLAWYWPQLPPVLRDVEMYIAQDFYGVRERLKKESDVVPRSVVVATLTPTRPVARHPDCVLVNLGGLQNPYWTTEMAVRYATEVLESALGAIPPGERVIVVASAKVAAALPGVTTYEHAQMLDLLPRVKYAFATPGLGNIYDLASHGVPTIFLPPANDSQGRQLELLAAHKHVDMAIDWSDVLGRRIDYSAQQQLVLQEIAHACASMQNGGAGRVHLESGCRQSVETVATLESSAGAGLMDQFGRGGVADVVDIVSECVLSLGLGA